MQIVRCNACGKWIGKEQDLGYEKVNEPGIEYCPNCKSVEALMNVDYGCNFDDTELEKLWEMLGEIPVGDNDEIVEEFVGFPEGTDKIEIWQWFDEKYSRGVVALLNPESVARKVCSRCGSDVLPEEDEELKKEYPYYCPECDENMYSFECKDKGVMENESNCSAGSGRKTSGGNGPGL